MTSISAGRPLTVALAIALACLTGASIEAGRAQGTVERRELPGPAAEPADDRYAQIYGSSTAPRPGYQQPGSGVHPRYDTPPEENYRPRPARNDAYVPPPNPAYDAPSSTVPGGEDDQYDRRAEPRYGAPYRDREPEPTYRPTPSRDYDDADDPRDGTFSMREITQAGHGFFGSISKGLASVIEHAFRSKGRPNGYILGQDLGGAFVAGLRYGEGRLYTRDAGTHPVYWQGPSLGYDAGAEGSKVMVLVYNLRDPADVYQRFGGVAGSAYVIGGVGLTFQSHGDIVLAPIRAGVGLRLGANIGYLKYTRRPTWNPF